MSSSSVRVQIIIEIVGPITDNGTKPAELTWEHNVHTGDNPRFYSQEAKRALAEAADLVKESLSLYDPAN